MYYFLCEKCWTHTIPIDSAIATEDGEWICPVCETGELLMTQRDDLFDPEVWGDGANTKYDKGE
jgi:Zn finger protein HypA/HybF involved in hydrogenase expression